MHQLAQGSLQVTMEVTCYHFGHVLSVKSKPWISATFSGRGSRGDMDVICLQRSQTANPQSVYLLDQDGLLVFKRNVPKATLRSFRKQTGSRRQLPSQLVLGSRSVPHMVWRFQITAPCLPSSLSTKRHVERSDRDHYMEREAASPNPVLCFKTKLRTKQLGDTLLMAAECKCPLKENALSEKNIFNAL